MNMTVNLETHIHKVHWDTFLPYTLKSQEYNTPPLHCPPPQHRADSPQVQSWSGRSQYRRNSAGHPSGLRWLSYMPQSDSVRKKKNAMK